MTNGGRGAGGRRGGGPRRGRGSRGQGSRGQGGRSRAGQGGRGRGRSDGERRRPERKPGLGGEQVEGRHAVLEALVAGRRRVRDVWIAGELDPAPIVERIRDEAAASGVPVHVVTAEDLDERARSEAHQGVVARADPIPEAGLDGLLADPAAFLVALDGVTDPQNLGAVLRTAEGAGATGVVLPKRRSARLSPAVAKAAAGAVEHLPMAHVPGIPAALERAVRAGVWVVGIDGDAEASLFDLPVADGPVMLVLGAEGRGLARLTKERCDLTVGIPMLGAVASLNVSAAAALACYEVARRRGG